MVHGPWNDSQSLSTKVNGKAHCNNGLYISTPTPLPSQVHFKDVNCRHREVPGPDISGVRTRVRESYRFGGCPTVDTSGPRLGPSTLRVVTVSEKGVVPRHNEGPTDVSKRQRNKQRETLSLRGSSGHRSTDTHAEEVLGPLRVDLEGPTPSRCSDSTQESHRQLGTRKVRS